MLIALSSLAVLAAGLIGVAKPAMAAKYSVAQCGWGVGHDADWSETASLRFARASLCVPGGSDVWEGVRMRTFTRPQSGSAAATTLGRWRWTAPPGTLITRVNGAWWHELRSGFQHRLGGTTPSGSFQRAHTGTSNQSMRSFTAGFGSGVRTFESRLLCARAGSNRCDTNPSSQAMVRALTITLDDSVAPSTSISGPVLEGGWLRGNERLEYSASDQGSGLKWAETEIDGSRYARSQFPCDQVQVAGEWRGTRMRPCALKRDRSQTIRTTELVDGSHSLRHCVEDFSGNRGCSATRTIRVDNTPPSAPRNLEIPGVEGWSRSPEFDLRWSNPPQAPGSPIDRAGYRVRGPGDFDTGIRHQRERGISSISGIEVREPGSYSIEVWLRDEAGNEERSNRARATYRFDDVPPTVEFRGFTERRMPEVIRARVIDEHSGPASGLIQYREQGAVKWIDLATELEEARHEDEVDLVARFPSDQVEPGVYEFRAVARDRAGNRAESRKRIDGTRMSVSTPVKAPTGIAARLEAGGRGGRNLTVPFTARPKVAGRLVRGVDSPLAGRELRIRVSPIAGSRGGPETHTVRTGEDGEFSLELEQGTSRGVEVGFAGSETLAATRTPKLSLAVRGMLELRASRRALRTGQVLVLGGVVDTRYARIPPRGKLVAIQYFETQARRWRPIAFARTDADGRFRTRYRFRYTTRPSRIGLRAVAVPEARWPYAAGASRPIAVRVFPRSFRRGASGARRSGSSRPSRRSAWAHAGPAAGTAASRSVGSRPGG